LDPINWIQKTIDFSEKLFFSCDPWTPGPIDYSEN
jgi:hypothetical protein